MGGGRRPAISLERGLACDLERVESGVGGMGSESKLSADILKELVVMTGVGAIKCMGVVTHCAK